MADKLLRSLTPKIELGLQGLGSRKRKRNKLTSSQKLWVWENTPHKCHICGKRIAKQSDAEFDHIRANSKGGMKMKLAHKFCNRLKSNKGLKKIQKTLGIKSKTKRKTIKKKRRKSPKSLFPTFKIPKFKI